MAPLIRSYITLVVVASIYQVISLDLMRRHPRIVSQTPAQLGLDPLQNDYMKNNFKTANPTSENNVKEITINITSVKDPNIGLTPKHTPPLPKNLTDLIQAVTNATVSDIVAQQLQQVFNAQTQNANHIQDSSTQNSQINIGSGNGHHNVYHININYMQAGRSAFTGQQNFSATLAPGTRLTHNSSAVDQIIVTNTNVQNTTTHSYHNHHTAENIQLQKPALSRLNALNIKVGDYAVRHSGNLPFNNFTSEQTNGQQSTSSSSSSGKIALGTDRTEGTQTKEQVVTRKNIQDSTYFDQKQRAAEIIGLQNPALSRLNAVNFKVSDYSVRRSGNPHYNNFVSASGRNALGSDRNEGTNTKEQVVTRKNVQDTTHFDHKQRASEYIGLQKPALSRLNAMNSDYSVRRSGYLPYNNFTSEQTKKQQGTFTSDNSDKTAFVTEGLGRYNSAEYKAAMAYFKKVTDVLIQLAGGVLPQKVKEENKAVIRPKTIKSDHRVRSKIDESDDKISLIINERDNEIESKSNKSDGEVGSNISRRVYETRPETVNIEEDIRSKIDESDDEIRPTINESDDETGSKSNKRDGEVGTNLNKRIYETRPEPGNIEEAVRPNIDESNDEIRPIINKSDDETGSKSNKSNGEVGTNLNKRIYETRQETGNIDEVVRPKIDESDDDIRPIINKSDDETWPKSNKSDGEVVTNLNKRIYETKPETGIIDEVVRPKIDESDDNIRPIINKSDDEIGSKSNKSDGEVRIDLNKRIYETRPETGNIDEVVRPKTDESDDDIRPVINKSDDETGFKSNKSDGEVGTNLNKKGLRN